jgi:comEA protein
VWGPKAVAGGRLCFDDRHIGGHPRGGLSRDSEGGSMHAVPIILAMVTSLVALPTEDLAAAGAATATEQHKRVAASAQESQEPIDVNTASEEQLEVIPGIGPAMAQRIIAWREENGRFESVEDLLNIRGIGVKTLEKLRPYVVVRPNSASGGR